MIFMSEKPGCLIWKYVQHVSIMKFRSALLAKYGRLLNVKSMSGESTEQGEWSFCLRNWKNQMWWKSSCLIYWYASSSQFNWLTTIFHSFLQTRRVNHWFHWTITLLVSDMLLLVVGQSALLSVDPPSIPDSRCRTQPVRRSCASVDRLLLWVSWTVS